MEDTRVYGYIRVSSVSQNIARQKDALLERGVKERDIFIDKASGKDFNRPNYQKMKSLLREGDTIVCLDLDRLGRNYDEIADEWKYITRDKKCNIDIVNMPILSTTQANGNLDTRFISEMMLQLLSYIAERERQHIRERQREGIESAMKAGVKFGRTPIEKPPEFSSVYQRVLRREITNREAMRELGLKPNTYYRFIDEEKKK